MLRFPYLPDLAGTAVRWRPLTRVDVIGPTGRRRYKALFDPGSDESVFPIAIVRPLGVTLRPDTREKLRWRGQIYDLRFGDVELELTDNVSTYRWPARVGFSTAPMPYVLLGYRGCLQFFDATFRGAACVIEADANPAYPGTMK